MHAVPAPNLFQSLRLYSFVMFFEATAVGYVGALICSASNPLNGALCGAISAIATWVFDSNTSRNSNYAPLKMLLIYPIAIQSIVHLIFVAFSASVSLKLALELTSFYLVAWIIAQLINALALVFCFPGVVRRGLTDLNIFSFFSSTFTTATFNHQIRMPVSVSGQEDEDQI